MRMRPFFALLPTVQLAVALVASAQQQSPALEFPVQGLDDMAAYRDYQTRFFRDTSGNTIQVVLNQGIGRIVNLWADAANESMSFSLRDSANALPRFSWHSPGARASSDGALRILEYSVTVHSPVVMVGHLLLGSMRKERDLQYAKRELLPLDSLPPVEPELLRLLANLSKLPERERHAQLSLLRASVLDEVSARLHPHLALMVERGRWTFTVRQRTFDGVNHLLLQLSDDTTNSHADLAKNILRIRSRAGQSTGITVRIGTDSPPLSPLTRNDIFTSGFNEFFERTKAESEQAAGPQKARTELLDRQVKSVELLSSREKLMAGLPNYATYFGRDMMMSAMMMESILRPSMQEYVISAMLRKLSPEGKVSHEEALGGQAIRENADVYNAYMETYFKESDRGNRQPAERSLRDARSILRDLQAVRENYRMVDETFQLPVIMAKYLAREDVPAKKKKAFLLDSLNGETRVARLIRNLRYVVQNSAPFVAHPDALHLVSFLKQDDGTWISGSWRDSNAGYAGGRFAMDVNAVLVPKALAGMKTIVTQLHELGLSTRQLGLGGSSDEADSDFRRYVESPSKLDRPIERWNRAVDFFVVRFGKDEVHKRVLARLAALPGPQRAYWEKILPAAADNDSIRFFALSLDSLGRPIPVMNTDPATWLFLADLIPVVSADTSAANRVHDALRTFVLPYPVGLFVSGLGALVANDAYAAPNVWERFEKDQYHSPRVVWGREVNLILLGSMKLLQEIRRSGKGKDLAEFGPLVRHLSDVLAKIRTAVDTSGMKQNELWTYRVEGGTLRPARYEFSCDIQLWNLTDLAVQYEFERLEKKGR